jgi:hypothetical protein
MPTGRRRLASSLRAAEPSSPNEAKALSNNPADNNPGSCDPPRNLTAFLTISEIYTDSSINPNAAPFPHILCGRRDSNPHPRRDRDLNPQASVRGCPSRFEKVLVYWAFVGSRP